MRVLSHCTPSQPTLSSGEKASGQCSVLVQYHDMAAHLGGAPSTISHSMMPRDQLRAARGKGSGGTDKGEALLRQWAGCAVSGHLDSRPGHGPRPRARGASRPVVLRCEEGMLKLAA